MSYVKFRTGDEADRTAYTPVNGEPLWTTDDKELWVGDNSTAGGIFIGPVTDASGFTLTDDHFWLGDGSNLAAETQIDDLTIDGSPDGANDYVMTWDADAGGHKRVLLSNLPVTASDAGALLFNARKASAGTIARGLPVYLVGYNVGGWPCIGEPTCGGVGAWLYNCHENIAGSSCMFDVSLLTQRCK